MGKIFVKYIGKENIQIADNTWKRFPISSVINEKQIKTTMKWHYTSFKWLWLNKDRKIISSVCRATRPSAHCWWELQWKGKKLEDFRVFSQRKQVQKEISYAPVQIWPLLLNYYLLCKARQSIPSFSFCKTYYVLSPCWAIKLKAVAKTHFSGCLGT